MWHNKGIHYHTAVFLVPKKTKLEVDTTSIILSHLYHFVNVNKELLRFKTEKHVVLAKYFGRYRRIINWSREVICRVIIRIYLCLSNMWKPCHGAINSWQCNLKPVLEMYFQFHWNCKQIRDKARKNMSYCEIYFLIFSHTTHTILKIISQHGLWKCRQRLLFKKNRVLQFLARFPQFL